MFEHIKKTEEKKMKFESNVIELEAHDKKEEDNGKTVDKNKNIRTLEEFSFFEEVENLNQLLDSEQHKTNPAIDVIEGAQADLKKQFERCKEAQRQYFTILDIQSGQEEISWMKKIRKIYSQINLKVGIFMQNHKKNTKLAVSKNEMSAGQGIRLEHIKMPVFDGDIRDYPRFKSDFLKQVVPEMESKDSMAYVLRSCLTKIPLDIVKNVDDDLDEMWKRLDEKYGKPSKLADVVMYDIKKLSAIREGDDKRFIDLVDIVEKSYRDLLRVGIEREISNTSTVRIIEVKLPKDIRREWSREVNRTDSKVEESNKFPYLLNFLLEQKRIIEYESMSLCTGGVPIKGYANHLDEDGDNSNEIKDEQTVQWKPQFQCWIHSTNKHTIGECKVYLGKQPEDRVRTLKENRACYSCLRLGIDHLTVNAGNNVRSMNVKCTIIRVFMRYILLG